MYIIETNLFSPSLYGTNMFAADIRGHGRGSYIEYSQLSKPPLDIADLKCECERYLEGFGAGKFI